MRIWWMTTQNGDKTKYLNSFHTESLSQSVNGKQIVQTKNNKQQFSHNFQSDVILRQCPLLRITHNLIAHITTASSKTNSSLLFV